MKTEEQSQSDFRRAFTKELTEVIWPRDYVAEVTIMDIPDDEKKTA